MPGGFAVRFAGDFGDGVQFLGSRFAAAALRAGLRVATRADPPAEIRAPVDSPAGAQAVTVRVGPGLGVPGEAADFVAALGPAALPLFDWPGAELLIDSARCDAGESPRAVGLPLAALTLDAGGPGVRTPRDAERSTRYLILGLALARFGLPIDGEIGHARGVLALNPPAAEAAARALRAGAELAAGHFPAPGPLPEPGEAGELVPAAEALARGLSAAATLAGARLVAAHAAVPPFVELPGLALIRDDDPAAVALGAGRGGALGVALTAGPALAAALPIIDLALSARIPLLLIHAPRRTRGPGHPEPWAQPDLPAVAHSGALVLSASSPGELYAAAIAAARAAWHSGGPVVVLAEPALMLAAESVRLPRALAPIRAATHPTGRGATLGGAIEWPVPPLNSAARSWSRRSASRRGRRTCPACRD